MKIIIAEDEFMSREFLKNMLQKQGHHVLEAQDGQKAWELYQKNKVDLVISDWIMPNMNGLTLCRRIRSFLRESYTYIIILTAKDNKEDLFEVFNSGADDYVTKPFDIEELKSRIKTGERIINLEKNHQQLQHELIESRNKVKIVFDALQEEIVALNDQFQIVSANKAYKDKIGTSFKNIIGQLYFSDRNNEGLSDAEKAIKKKVEKVFGTGLPQFLTVKSARINGEVKYRYISFHPVKNQAEKVYQVVIVSKDVTDEKKKTDKIIILNKELMKKASQIQVKNRELEQTLRKLEETQSQMLQSEKMASIGQLAAGVAHEINNPTGFVSSNLKTLSDYVQDFTGLSKEYQKLVADLGQNSDKMESQPLVFEQVNRIKTLEKEIDLDFILKDTFELIEETREGAERIKKIVQDLKDFAHPGEDKPKFVDINKNLDSTVNVVWNELKYKADVVKDYGPLPQVKCYPHLLNQVFLNLLVNSAQAIEDHGDIKIKTRMNNGYIEIKISDTGCGIPKENLSKIYDPFFTTKEVGKGTGLGLNMAYNIIQKHKGKINVESEPGKGTTFTLRLSTTEEPA